MGLRPRLSDSTFLVLYLLSSSPMGHPHFEYFLCLRLGNRCVPELLRVLRSFDGDPARSTILPDYWVGCSVTSRFGRRAPGSSNGTSAERRACGRREFPWPSTRHGCAAHRRCRARPHAPHGFRRSTPHPSLHAATAAALSTHSSHWGRHPEADTCWQSDSPPGDRSRTGTLPWDRVRLPSEPGGRL